MRRHTILFFSFFTATFCLPLNHIKYTFQYLSCGLYIHCCGLVFNIYFLDHYINLFNLYFCFHFYLVSNCTVDFPGSSVVKNLPVSAGVTEDAGLSLVSGKFPGEGNSNPFQYSCMGNLMDRGDWQAQSMRSQSWT